MSNAEKGGMQFFKNFAGKGTKEKTSMFGGMKIKGTKETKQMAQTQTNFNFCQSKSQEAAQTPTVKDDFSIKRETQQTAMSNQAQPKPFQATFKRTGSKLSENSNTTSDKSIKKTLSNTKEQNQKKEEIAEIQSPKIITQRKRQDIKIQRKEVQTPKYPTIQPAATVESTKPNQIMSIVQKKKPTPAIKKVEGQSVLANHQRKGSSVIKQSDKKKEQQKPKKSDRQQVLDQINEYNLKLANIVLSQKEIKVQIAETTRQIQQHSQNIAKWVSQQSLCAKNQEYEEADRLQTQIEECEKAVQQKQIELNFMNQQLNKQQYDEINLLKNQNSNMKRIGRKLKLIELQLQDDAANLKREEIEKIQGLKNKQQAEKKKIQRIQKDINYQSEQISQFQKVFQLELNSKLSPLTSDKNKLEEEKSKLDTQIKELQRLLKQKRGEVGEVNKKLKSITQNIDQINESYQEQTEKLKERKQKLQSVQNDRDDMLLTVTELQSKISHQVKQMDSKFQQKMSQAKQLADLAKNIQEKQFNFDDQLESRKVSLDNFLHNTKILKEYQSKHKAEKEKLKEHQYKKNNVTAQINKLEEKRDLLKKKIPALQADQKKFAEQKNFKAAGMKKNEVKQISDELNKIKQKIQDYLGEEHQLTMELQQISTDQKQALQEQNMLQKNMAISHYKFYSQKLKKIEEYRHQISKASNMNAKEKQKLVKELSLQIERLTQELKYINIHYELDFKTSSKEHIEDNENEDEDVIQAQIQEQQCIQEQPSPDNVKPYEDSNDNTNEPIYEPPQLLIQEQQEEEQIIEDQGYVPLQLD